MHLVEPISMDVTTQGNQTVNIGQPQDGLSQPEVRRMPRRSNWSSSSDELLVKILLEECSANRTCSSSFSPAVWARVFNVYQKKTKEDITMQQLKGKWKTLKKLYRLYSSLVNKSGWSWDYDNQRPTPGCPTVWEEIIQFNKEYKVARDKPFPLFWMIHELAGSSTATGQYASHTGGGMYRDTLVVDVNEGTDSSEEAVHVVQNNTAPTQQAGSKHANGDFASGSFKRKAVRNSSTTGTKRRSQEQTMEIVDKLVDLSAQRSVMAEEGKKEEDSCSYGATIDKLASLPDITDEELFVRGEALRSRKTRIFFMKMRPSATAYWLSVHMKEYNAQD